MLSNLCQQSIKMKSLYFRISILLTIFVFCLILRLLTLNQIGRTWDEQEYVEQGYKMVELMKKGDFYNSYFYTTYDHPPLVKYLYGISAHFDIEKYLSNGEAVLKYDLTYSRILSAIMFSLGVVMVMLIGWNFISLSVGIIAGIILSLLPFSLGLSQLVTTESFKIFIYPLAFYLFIKLLQNYSFKKVIIVGIIMGIALQIKQSNIILIPLFGLISYMYYRQLNQGVKKKAFFKKNFLSLIYIGIISILVFFLFWPQILLHFSEIYATHSGLWHVQFSPKIWLITISVPEIFFGRLMLTPNFYYLVYFFISIPIVILGLFLIGIKKIFTKKDWILHSFILWFFIPIIIMSFYSWRQHGLRYVIEVYPAICLIAAVGFDSIISRFTKKESWKLFLFFPVIIYLSVILLPIKPYYLDYFNELVGGTDTVYKYKLFQQGWWGQGIGEAGYYIRKTAPKGSTIGYALSPDFVLPRFSEFKYEKWLTNKKYDYVIVNYYNIIREGFNDEYIRKNYKLIYEVKANNAILVYIYKRK